MTTPTWLPKAVPSTSSAPTPTPCRRTTSTGASTWRTRTKPYASGEQIVSHCFAVQCLDHVLVPFQERVQYLPVVCDGGEYRRLPAFRDKRCFQHERRKYCLTRSRSVQIASTRLFVIVYCNLTHGFRNHGTGISPEKYIFPSPSHFPLHRDIL